MVAPVGTGTGEWEIIWHVSCIMYHVYVSCMIETHGHDARQIIPKRKHDVIRDLGFRVHNLTSKVH